MNDKNEAKEDKNVSSQGKRLCFDCSPPITYTTLMINYEFISQRINKTVRLCSAPHISTVNCLFRELIIAQKVLS